METELARQALVTLLREIYIGPGDSQMTWVTSPGPESGLLGTLGSLTSVQAAVVLPGSPHSVAAHAAHLRFTLDLALSYAKGATPGPEDWGKSWITGPMDDAGWAALQTALATSVRALIDFAEKQETFKDLMAVTGFFGQVAHGAYHLGIIRHHAALVRATR